MDEYVLMMHVRRSGSTPKVVPTWSVACGDGGVTRRSWCPEHHFWRGAGCPRRSFGYYADSKLGISSDFKDVCQHLSTKGAIQMGGVLRIGEAHDAFGYVVRVRWTGSDETEDTRKPLYNGVGQCVSICFEEIA